MISQSPNIMMDPQLQSSPSRSLPVTSFIDRRVNSSTILIIEDDEYGEHPHIYVKIYPNHLLITDTGCNAPRSKEPSLTSLREYLETYPVPSNNHQVLNPNGHKRYIIICTHCHYDHILGIPSFLSSNPHIIASSNDPSFILKDLPTNSLCSSLGIPTPEYTITHWARHLSHLVLDDNNNNNNNINNDNNSSTHFRIQFLHIPGHTPDSLCWYDIDEHHLYVGDTLYTSVSPHPIPSLPVSEPIDSAIIFPATGGNLTHYIRSLDTLLSFIQHKNKTKRSMIINPHGFEQGQERMRLSSGHITYNADAEDIVSQARAFVLRIICDEIPVSKSLVRHGVLCDFYEEEGGRFGVLTPRRLVEEARGAGR